MKRQSDRFRESRERRDKANAELERLLLEELWEDRQSQMHIPPVVVPPAHPAVVTAETESSGRGLSTQAKQVITIVATAVALALVGALKGMGATTEHQIPTQTTPEP